MVISAPAGYVPGFGRDPRVDCCPLRSGHFQRIGRSDSSVTADIQRHLPPRREQAGGARGATMVRLSDTVPGAGSACSAGACRTSSRAARNVLERSDTADGRDQHVERGACGGACTPGGSSENPTEPQVPMARKSGITPPRADSAGVALSARMTKTSPNEHPRPRAREHEANRSSRSRSFLASTRFVEPRSPPCPHRHLPGGVHKTHVRDRVECPPVEYPAANPREKLTQAPSTNTSLWTKVDEISDSRRPWCKPERNQRVQAHATARAFHQVCRNLSDKRVLTGIAHGTGRPDCPDGGKGGEHDNRITRTGRRARKNPKGGG